LRSRARIAFACLSCSFWARFFSLSSAFRVFSASFSSLLAIWRI
jgi:hypothetical protein